MTKIVKYDFIQGSSSLLFIISAVKAFYSSKLPMWKASNTFLVVASYLCNASDYEKNRLLLDYIAIIMVCTSYMNNAQFNSAIYLCLISEYLNTGSIKSVKDATFGTTVAKTIVNTYLYVDKAHFYVILTSAITSMILYKIRYILYESNNRRYHNHITWIFHTCIMLLMYIASSTAV